MRTRIGWLLGALMLVLLGLGWRLLVSEPRNNANIAWTGAASANEAPSSATPSPAAAVESNEPMLPGERAPVVARRSLEAAPELHDLVVQYVDHETLVPFAVKAPQIEIRSVQLASGGALRGSMHGLEFEEWLRRSGNSAIYGEWARERLGNAGQVRVTAGIHEVRRSVGEPRLRLEPLGSWFVTSPETARIPLPARARARLRGDVVYPNGQRPERLLLSIGSVDAPKRTSAGAGVSAFDGWFLTGEIEIEARTETATVRETVVLGPFEVRELQLVIEDRYDVQANASLDLAFEGNPSPLEVRLAAFQDRRDVFLATNTAPPRATALLDPKLVTEPGDRATGWREASSSVTRFEGLAPGHYLILAREVGGSRARPHHEIGEIELAESEAGARTVVYPELTGPRVRGFVWDSGGEPRPVRVQAFALDELPLSGRVMAPRTLAFDIVLPAPGSWQIGFELERGSVCYTEIVRVGAHEVLERHIVLPRGSIEIWPEGPTLQGTSLRATIRRLGGALSGIAYRTAAMERGRYSFGSLPDGDYAFDPPNGTALRFDEVPTLRVSNGATTTHRVRVEAPIR